MTKKIPLIYSCSGCSSAAQMTNYLAVQLDRRGIAEMSCITGIGGNISTLVKKAKSDRDIVVIDGCPLSCSKACLRNHQIEPAIHIELSSLGVKKLLHQDFNVEEAKTILEMIQKQISGPRFSHEMPPTKKIIIPFQNDVRNIVKEPKYKAKLI